MNARHALGKPGSRSAAGGSGPAGGASAAVAYSRAAGSAAVECAWCGRPFDGRDEHRPGRIRCRRCGVATTSPWPGDRRLAAAYGGWYRPETGRFSGFGDALLRRTRSTLARCLHWRLPRGPVLDVGAGDGTLVRAFRRNGREALGVDPYTPNADPHVRAGEIEDVAGTWSGIIFWHSLQHLRRPARALRYAASLLVPGGLLVIALPNAASLQARLFGDRWFHLDLPRQLVHLTRPALLAELEALGLRVERVRYLRGGQVLFGWLHGIVGRLPGHPDLYDAIRRRQARRAGQRPAVRLYALAAAVAVLPLALVATAVEVGTRSGGTLYVEARRRPDPAGGRHSRPARGRGLARRR
ncbi:MAG TPA: class I SAM-dependent methyltransferase [Trebonia sp.]|nr:class I SAM-dependent methyltransferase [Trebonia sp.]